MSYAEKLRSERWRETRARIIDRAGGRCEYCDEPTENFNVHHLKYVGNHPSDTPDKHLVAICYECHDQEHWHDRLRKRAKYIEKMGKRGACMQLEDAEILSKRFDI